MHRHPLRQGDPEPPTGVDTRRVVSLSRAHDGTYIPDDRLVEIATAAVQEVTRAFTGFHRVLTADEMHFRHRIWTVVVEALNELARDAGQVQGPTLSL